MGVVLSPAARRGRDGHGRTDHARAARPFGDGQRPRSAHRAGDAGMSATATPATDLADVALKRSNGAGPAPASRYAVTFDGKGKLQLPELPPREMAAQCAW